MWDEQVPVRASEIVEQSDDPHEETNEKDGGHRTEQEVIRL